MSISDRVTGAFAGTAIALPILLVLAGLGGWIANIVKIFGSAGDPLTAFFIIRCVGVFIAPVGAVLGFL